jgi:hypothetical protein
MYEKVLQSWKMSISRLWGIYMPLAHLIMENWYVCMFVCMYGQMDDAHLASTWAVGQIFITLSAKECLHPRSVSGEFWLEN